MKNNTIKIGFVGDIAVNGDYISMFKKGVRPFDDLFPLLSGMNYVIGNLECLSSGNQGENPLKRPRLTTTYETLGYLNQINLSVASLAQNHIYDHLEDGFEKTIDFLNKNSIAWLGAGKTQEEASKPIIIDESDIILGFLNYVTEDTNTGLPIDAGVKLNIFNIPQALEDIKALKKHTDHVIVLLHWGGRVEGGMFPDFDQPKIARQLIDVGADLIIGHHPHTFQPYEMYKGKHIFYSLGNFCFSDFVFENKSTFMPKRRRISTIVDVQFSKNSYEVKMQFFKNGMTHFKPYQKYNRQVQFRNFIFKRILKHYLFWSIYYFIKKNILPLYLFFLRRDIPFQQKITRVFKSLQKKLR